MPPNSLRGEFTAILGGEAVRFDTTLASIARMEEACGGRSILEAVNGVVTGRRAADQITLLSAALRAAGRLADEADRVAACATVPEAEAFVLALMAALGFKLTPRPGEREEGGPAAGGPLDASSAGGAGAPSRSAA